MNNHIVDITYKYLESNPDVLTQEANKFLQNGGE